MCSSDLRQTIRMPVEEQESRMARMRRIVRENNVYRWAGNLMAALSEIRIERPEKSEKAEKANRAEKAEKAEKAVV